MMSLMPYYTARPAAAENMLRSFFSDPFFSPFLSGRTPERRMHSMMRVDVEDVGDSYLLTADMPGMRREDIRLSVEDGVLTISAEYEHASPNAESETDTDRRYIYQERRSGSMSRSFSLEGVKEEDIHAEYADGVLRVTLPKQTAPEKAPVRRIEIR
jgi:HSP20 family protein